MMARLNSSTSGSEVQEEKSDGSIHEEAKRGGTRGQFCEESTSKSSSPNLKSSGTRKEHDELESAKAEMTEVRQENARLKMMLEQIEKDYQSLQTCFIDTIQHESKKKNDNLSRIHEDDIEEPELVSLRLGRSPSEPKRDSNTNTNTNTNTSSSSKTREDHEQLNEDLKLGLDYNFQGSNSKSDCVDHTSDQSKDNSLEEIVNKEEQAGETWPPSKVLKTMRSGDDELSQQSSLKRARVSVRARCDTPTMNDGCQWRKYGQKIAKGNPCPRAYYRCTVAPSCPVRKQVQRCADDMSILITTYEGTHNHPLPISATAMASTTSAAASMLMSGSSTSQLQQPGLNFNLSDNSISRTRQFYLPNSSSQPFPTITLDLTSTSTPSTHFNTFSSSFPSAPRFSSTGLSFSSSESNILPTVWGNGYPNYGTLPYNNKTNIGFYQPSYTDQKNNQQGPSDQQFLTETLTKAITSDPSFRSAIAAAISSINGKGETIQAVNSNPLNPNGKACSSSYLNRSLNSQVGNLMLQQQQQPPLPFSLSKNTSVSAADSRDQIN
ncbi:unnamed protein product [Camellia sinensis]